MTKREAVGRAIQGCNARVFPDLPPVTRATWRSLGDGLRGLAHRWYRYRPTKAVLLVLCVLSFPLSIAAGFATDGWVTGERAEMLTHLAAVQARTDLVATACVNRFRAAPDVAGRLAALRRVAPWYRGVTLQEAGWTTVAGLPDHPGSEEPVIGAGDLCAQRLLTAQGSGPRLASAAPSTGG